MATEYGEGGSFTVKMEGPFGNAGSSVLVTEINAPVENWKGAVSPFSQVVNVDRTSANSKVDIQLSMEQLELLRDQEIAFTTENDGGVVTLFAIGDKPLADITFQATLTEVVV